MSRVDELLRKWCPDGVEFKRLGDIATLSNTGVDKKIIPGETEVALLNYMDICRENKISQKSLSAITSASPKKIVECNLLKGDVFITPSSETRDDLANAAELVSDVPNAVYSYHIMRIRLNDLSQINPTFLVHLFASQLIQEQIIRLSTGMTRYGLTKPKWESLNFPVPPIEIQLEVARILDKYMELEEELEAKLEEELEARKIQYESVSKSLLDFSDADSQQVAVSEICRVSRGTVISKDYLRDHPGSFPVYSSQTLNNGIFGYIDTFAYGFESLTWTTDGANAGSIFFHQNEKFTITNVCGLLQVLDPARVSTRFLYYVLSIEASKYVSAGMGNPKLMAGTMGDIQIKVPSLKKQEEIVAILDKFDALVNGIIEKLPAEIVARRKQYEYYRNMLLTFKALEVA